jgi:hypothetical protein
MDNTASLDIAPEPAGFRSEGRRAKATIPLKPKPKQTVFPFALDDD